MFNPRYPKKKSTSIFVLITLLILVNYRTILLLLNENGGSYFNKVQDAKTSRIITSLV